MCRNIKPLFNFDPPATDVEIRDAALQFVRKVSGSTKPSKRNQEPFDRAVAAISACVQELFDSMETTQHPRNREEEAAKARARMIRSRFRGRSDPMSFFPGNDPPPGDAFACDAIELMVIPNARDIGGFEVRRALPTAKRRLVGPFIFFDRMGPAILRADQALDVRPHPHIGLATVTYLFDGKIRHRDSLGTEMVIEPGDVNLMTAGRGIVHSERSPEELRGAPMSVSGLQTWLALPDGKEEVDPLFANTARASLPAIDADGVSGRVVIGAFDGIRSPVASASDTLYVDLRLEPARGCALPPIPKSARSTCSTATSSSRATASPPTGCWCSGRATRSSSAPKVARI